LTQWQPQDGIWLWAEPVRGTLNIILTTWKQKTSIDAQLFIIHSGKLAKRLPEWKSPPYPCIASVNTGELLQSIHKHNLKIQQKLGFHGFRSILLGYASIACYKAKRYAWSDRLIYAMRRSYVVNDWQVKFTPVQVYVVGKN